MQCPDCSFDNPTGMKFCGDCGSKLPAVCGACGAAVVAGFKFCGQCGTRLEGQHAASATPTAPTSEASTASTPAPVQLPAPTPAGPPSTSARMGSARTDAVAGPAEDDPAGLDSEIKQVSVVLCEMTCAGEATLGAEQLHALLSQFLEVGRVEIDRFGGTVSQVLQGGFMALFGAPVSFEDHSRRALLAALHLIRRLESRTTNGDEVALSARVGIASGAVVVGGAENMVVGEATQRAERLLAAAAPGEVLVGSRVAEQVRAQVELQTLADEGDPKGFRVTGTLSILSSAKGERDRRRTAFVGRAQELATLGDLMDQARAGHGHVIGIAGEAGTGKSRLLKELFRRTGGGAGSSYLRGRCLSYGSSIPYLPLIRMIRDASGVVDSDDSAEVAAKLRASLEAMGTDPDEVLPYLLRLMGVEAGTESLDAMEPQTIQARTFSAMRRTLLNAARQSLVVVEMEDLHWIDQTSAEFLESLIEVVGVAPILLLVTYRAGYKPPWHGKSYATEITLRRLSDDDSRTLATQVLETAGTSASLLDAVLAKAEGNPLYIEELGFALAESESAEQMLVPNSIQGILMARIDAMPEPHRALLRKASLLGSDISLDVLAALWQRSTPLEPLLHDLRAWEFLVRAPSEDQTNHYFRHTLTQEVVYESLLSEQRRTLHHRAATALETLYADNLDDVFDQLIYHYPRAGDPEKTVHYLTRFAARAAANFAHAEAVKALREALPQAEELPGAAGERRVVEVMLQLAESLLPLARFPETLALCQRYAAQVARLDDPLLAAQHDFWLAHTHTYLGHQEATQRAARRAIEAAQSCGDEATEGKARYVLGRDGFWSGQFEDGIRNSLRAIVLLERSGEPWWQCQAYWVAGFNHYVLGQFDEGIRALERACAIGEALDDYRLDASWSLGYFYASLGQWEEGLARCRHGLDRSQDPLNTAVATGFLGYALLQKGNWSEAESTLRASIRQLRKTGMKQILGWFHVFLGEALLASGELDEARNKAIKGLRTCDAAHFRYGMGLAQHTLGRVALAADRLERAQERLEAADDVFSSLAVPFEMARTRLDLARLAERSGDSETATRDRAAARQAFEALGVTHYVDKVDASAGTDSAA